MSWLEPVEAGLVRAADAGEVISPAYDLFSSWPNAGAHGRLHPRSFLNCTPSEGDDPELDYRGRRRQAQRYLAERDRTRNLDVQTTTLLFAPAR